MSEMCVWECLLSVHRCCCCFLATYRCIPVGLVCENSLPTSSPFRRRRRLGMYTNVSVNLSSYFYWLFFLDYPLKSKVNPRATALYFNITPYSGAAVLNFHEIDTVCARASECGCETVNECNVNFIARVCFHDQVSTSFRAKRRQFFPSDLTRSVPQVFNFKVFSYFESIWRRVETCRCYLLAEISKCSTIQFLSLFFEVFPIAEIWENLRMLCTFWSFWKLWKFGVHNLGEKVNANGIFSDWEFNQTRKSIISAKFFYALIGNLLLLSRKPKLGFSSVFQWQKMDRFRFHITHNKTVKQ